MITHTDNTIFAIILTAAIFTFGFSVARLVRAIRLGKPDLRLRESLMKRFVTMLGYAFGQKRVLDELFGLNHFLLFWGFMILFFYNTTFILNGLFPEFSLSLAGPFLYPILTLLFDLVPVLSLPEGVLSSALPGVLFLSAPGFVVLALSFVPTATNGFATVVMALPGI